ncbi:MAG: Uma2 family endonuclease [Gammaproteobacteria bacterium]
MSYAMEHGPRPHRITVDEFHRMAEVGLLAPDARVELIEGVIIDMALIGGPHGRAVDHICERLILAVHGRAIVRTQGAVELSRLCEVQPDIALLKHREDGYDDNPEAADTLLLIEVADSSAGYDFGTKLKLYARYGVPEVWILSVGTGTLHFFRSRTDLGYSEEGSTTTPGVLTLPSLGGLTVDLSGLIRA